MDPRAFFETELPNRLLGVVDALPDGVVVGFELVEGGAWQLRAEGGRTFVEVGCTGPKDCLVRCSSDEFSRIIIGSWAATRAYLDGRLAIEGDVGLLLRLRPLLAARTA